MALKIDTDMSATAYHIVTGATRFPYAVDASHAISNHPLEWSDSPWSREDAAASRAKLDLPAAPPLAPDDQAALDEHNKAVEAAAKRLADYQDKKAKEQAEAEQAAADALLISSPPPQPDPTARKPLTPAQIRKQSATLTPAEEAAKEAKEKAEAKVISDKADADRIGIASRNTI